jgi:hypothetical protein
MNLELPTVSMTLGPEWAAELNVALDTIDSHDHSSGKGTPVTPAGLNINVDLDFLGNRATFLKSTQFNNQGSTLVGINNINSVYTFGGNLYYTNNSGVAVQITNGGSIVTAPSTVQAFQYDVFSSNVTISPSDSFVFMDFDTTAARTVDLPLASGVAAGRIYIISDGSGLSETNPITINASGSDLIAGSASLTLASDNGAFLLIGNGVSKWSIA